MEMMSDAMDMCDGAMDEDFGAMMSLDEAMGSAQSASIGALMVSAQGASLGAPANNNLNKLS